MPSGPEVARPVDPGRRQRPEHRDVHVGVDEEVAVEHQCYQPADERGVGAELADLAGAAGGAERRVAAGQHLGEERPVVLDELLVARRPPGGPG